MRRPPLSLDKPMVLLDDATSTRGEVRVYRDPKAVIEARASSDIPHLLTQARAATSTGAFVAGFLAYEAGAAFVPKITAPPGQRLAWFGVFERCERLTGADLADILPAASAGRLGALRPRQTNANYLKSLRTLLNLITAGDLYQANYTFRADLDFSGDPLGIYAGLRERQRAAYSGIVATGDESFLSLSPELFFSKQGDRIRCRPMKGTAARTDNPALDRIAAHDLRLDPKQRAENLMIVDLMRNDLARISIAGSVSVPDLFCVEEYPTVFQMVSTVAAELRAGLDAYDALAALFPCGSVTGAPKVRAMQVIEQLEDTSRGIYTGSIGFVDPNGDACFNVAIRTLSHRTGERRMTMGLGSGVVADSVPEAEWQECVDKARFLNARIAAATSQELRRALAG